MFFTGSLISNRMANHETIKEEIRKVLADFTNDYRNQRFDVIASRYYQPDSLLVLPGKPDIPYSEINQTYAAMYAEGWTDYEMVVDRFFITDKQVSVYDRAIRRDADGKEVTLAKAGVVFEKRDGKWFCVLDVTFPV